MNIQDFNSKNRAEMIDRIMTEKAIKEFNNIVEEVNTSMLFESVLDPIQKFRCDVLFGENNKEESPKIKKEAREFLIKIAEKFIKDIEIPGAKVKEFFMVGSSLGYQYREDSDIDCDLRINVKKEDMNGKFSLIPKNIFYPGSSHPVNIFLLCDDDPPYNFKENCENAYDILEDKWIKQGYLKNEYPIPYSYIAGVSEFIMDGIALQLQRADRHIQDVEKYMSLDPTKVEISARERIDAISDSINDLRIDMDALNLSHHFLFKFDGEGFNGEEFRVNIDYKASAKHYTINNLIYKYVDGFGYYEKINNKIKEIKSIIEKAEEELKKDNGLADENKEHERVQDEIKTKSIEEEIELGRCIFEAFQEFLDEEETSLNEGKFKDNMKWKFAKFSLRFLKEESITEFLELYYEKTKNKEALKAIKTMKKKEKLSRLYSIVDRIPEEDRSVINNMKIPTDFLNRKSATNDRDIKDLKKEAGLVSAVGGVGGVAGAAFAGPLAYLALGGWYPVAALTFLGTAVVSLIFGATCSIASVAKASKRFRVENMEKVKEYFKLSKDKESPTKKFDKGMMKIDGKDFILLRNEDSAALSIAERVVGIINSGIVDIGDDKKVIGEFSIKYHGVFHKANIPLYGGITVHYKDKKLLFLIRGSSIIPIFYLSQVEEMRATSDEIKRLYGTKYFTVEKNKVKLLDKSMTLSEALQDIYEYGEDAILDEGFLDKIKDFFKNLKKHFIKHDGKEGIKDKPKTKLTENMVMTNKMFLDPVFANKIRAIGCTYLADVADINAQSVKNIIAELKENFVIVEMLLHYYEGDKEFEIYDLIYSGIYSISKEFKDYKKIYLSATKAEKLLCECAKELAKKIDMTKDNIIFKEIAPIVSPYYKKIERIYQDVKTKESEEVLNNLYKQRYAAGLLEKQQKSLLKEYEILVYESRLPEDGSDPQFGIPQQKKYPLFDKEHVESAIKLFGHVEAQYEQQLARAIIAKMKTYKIPYNTVGKDNKLYKWIPEKYRESEYLKKYD